jgi:hypothetical protein
MMVPIYMPLAKRQVIFVVFDNQRAKFLDMADMQVVNTLNFEQSYQIPTAKFVKEPPKEQEKRKEASREPSQTSWSGIYRTVP